MSRLLLAILLLFAVPAGAAEMEPYRRLNEALVTHHVLPRYDRLLAATEALKTATAGGCGRPDALQAAFVMASDAWQGVQHIRFGPIELFMRSMRMAFWPDQRNSGGRQLDELIAARDPASITQASFDRGGIAVQGLPALERLLYGGDALARLAAGDAEAAFRCATIGAIGANLAAMAGDICRDWTEGADPFARTMSGGGAYADAKEATAELFKSLHAAIEIVADHKLARPLGASPQAARPALAEAYRSRRSIENIRINLEAAEAMYLGEGGMGFSDFVRDIAGDRVLDDLLRRAFAQTRATAASVTLPLEDAVQNAVERKKLMQLAREATALKSLLAQRLTVALDIPVGFNALDGD